MLYYIRLLFWRIRVTSVAFSHHRRCERALDITVFWRLHYHGTKKYQTEPFLGSQIGAHEGVAPQTGDWLSSTTGNQQTPFLTTCSLICFHDNNRVWRKTTLSICTNRSRAVLRSGNKADTYLFVCLFLFTVSLLANTDHSPVCLDLNWFFSKFSAFSSPLRLMNCTEACEFLIL